MVKKINKKVKIDPVHATIFLILTVTVLILILLRRILKQKVKEKDEDVDLAGILNEDNQSVKYKKQVKSKKRVKEVNKGNGFIPEKNRICGINENIRPKEDHNKLNLEKSDEKSNFHHKANNKIILQPKQKRLEKSEKSNSNNQRFLNENEKDDLYALMGLVTNHYEKERDYSIYSVEYLFESKFKTKSKIPEFDKNLNDELIEKSEKATNLKDLQDILNLYHKSIKNSSIIKHKTLINLVEVSLRLNEINHASFFLTEMDKYEYKIPRTILNNFINLQISIDAIQNKIREQNKRNFKQNQNNKFDKSLNKYLISPNTNFYLQSPEYFYYKSKRETYKGMNILNTLQTLNIKSEPFFPKKLKEKKDEIKENHKKENNLNLSVSETKSITIDSDSKPQTISQNQNDLNILSTSKSPDENTPTEDKDLYNSISKLKNLNINEIKEYVPKKFKLISK